MVPSTYSSITHFTHFNTKRVIQYSKLMIEEINRYRMKHFKHETWEDAKICKVLFSGEYECLMKSMILMVLKANEKKNFIADSFMSSLPQWEYFWKIICCALEIYFETRFWSLPFLQRSILGSPAAWCGPAWTLTFPIRAGRVSAL